MIKRWLEICRWISVEQDVPGKTELHGLPLAYVGALLLIAEKLHNLADGKARD
jgi:hypothetical protein